MPTIEELNKTLIEVVRNLECKEIKQNEQTRSSQKYKG